MILIHPGVKQDEDGNYYFTIEYRSARIVDKEFIDTPVRLRVAGKFFPAINTDEKPYHLERLNQITKQWEPLYAKIKGKETVYEGPKFIADIT